MEERPRDEDQPYYGQPPQFGQQSPYTGPQMYQPPPQPPKKPRSPAQLGCLGAIAVAVIVIIAVAVSSGGKSGNTATGVTTPTQTAAANASPAAAPATTSETTAADPATSSQPTVPDQVVFTCTGSAPDGVDITYGGEGSNFSASSLPFSKTLSLQTTEQYYNVTAQLSGSGHVSCTTVVDYQGSPTTQTGSAEGGYNIASAEVCSGFDGWEAC